MRNLQVIVITLFLVLAVSFSVVFAYDRLAEDHTPPMIYCDGEPLYVSVSATDKELCSGLTARDDRDGDLTERIIVRRVSQLTGPNTATAYYAVFDSASNFCTYTRTVYYTDYRKPRFSLSQPLIYNVNSVISLEGRLTAYDVLDGDISSRIRVGTSSLTNAAPGEYPLTVQVINSTGDISIVNLKVMIENITAQHPVIRLSEYLIYADLDTPLETEDLRSYIVSARETANGAKVDPADIRIDGEVDTSKRGDYDVRFSYTNPKSGLTYTVILTVVVE